MTMESIHLVEVSGLILGALVFLLAGGLWIGMTLLLCGFIAMQFAPPGISIGAALATNAWSGSASWSLTALPLFVWMGEILFRTRLSDEMFRGLSPWLNWLPGRLIHVNVLGCGLFGAVSGSSAATTATVAKITLPELKARGYDETISLGSIAGAGTLGLLVPPSIPMIVYAVAANVSIIQMFMAGLLPAVIVMVLYMGAIGVWALMNPGKMPPKPAAIPFRQKLTETLNLIPLALLILTVFSALLMGWATATECAAWGVLGSLVLAAWQRALTWKSFRDSVMGATRMTGMIMLSTLVNLATAAGHRDVVRLALNRNRADFLELILGDTADQTGIRIAHDNLITCHGDARTRIIPVAVHGIGLGHFGALGQFAIQDVKLMQRAVFGQNIAEAGIRGV